MGSRSRSGSPSSDGAEPKPAGGSAERANVGTAPDDAVGPPRVKRYAVPLDVLAALEQVFDEPGLERVAVFYRPWYVQCHLAFIGGWTGSVTRPGRIYTNIPEGLFFRLDAHVLHEYYHVVQQWGRERMTPLGYMLECRRRERDARNFAAANVERYRRLRAATRSEIPRGD